MTTSPKLEISVLIQTRNEERAISDCIGSLDDFAEIVVVDSNSTDRTAEIARRCGARVINFTWDGSYPKKKQWQLDNVSTSNDWVLFLDADEAPSRELIHELRTMASEGRLRTLAAIDIPLRYHFAGSELRFGHRVIKRSLVNRHRVSFPRIDDTAIPGMGELEGHYQPEATGPAHRAGSTIIHSDPDPVTTWFDRHNRYSDWEARIYSTQGVRETVQRSKSKQGRAFSRVPFKPFVFFFYSYIARLGILDGRAGFDYAVGLSFYYWQIGVKRREYERSQRRTSFRASRTNWRRCLRCR